jgi:putative ABC transport system permease protein
MKTLKVITLIAFRNLIQAWRRTAFLGSALTLVTMLLVMLMALSQGISENVVRAATILSTGHINVSGFYKTRPSDVAPLVTDAARLREVVSKHAGDVDYIVSRHRGFARIVSPTRSLQSLLAGVDITEEPQLLNVLQLATEAEYKEGGRIDFVTGDLKKLTDKNSIILFATQAKTLEVVVGDQLTLRTQALQGGAANTVDVTIVAIARDIGLLSNFSAFVPRQTILDLYQLKPDTTGAIQLYLKDIDKAPATMSTLRLALEDEGYQLLDYQKDTPYFAKFETVGGEDWVGQKLDLTLWQDEVSFLGYILTALDTVSVSLVTILVIIIAIGIMNAMWISVRKRTKEIGTVRAIGMHRSGVLAMFVMEALLLGLIATTLGALLGVLISWSINAAHIRVPVDAMRAILLSDTFYLAVSAERLVGAVAGLTLFTVLSALWPSIRAAQLQPVEAIHSAE